MTGIRLRVAAAVYGTLAVLAIGWGFLRGDPDLFHHPDGWLHLDVGMALAIGIPVGVAIGALFAWATRLAVRRTAFARRIPVEFRALFGPLAERDILLFSALSAVSEEIVFRGALQPILGLVLAALAFGLVTFTSVALAHAEPAETSSVQRRRPYVDYVLATVDARTDREILV